MASKASKDDICLFFPNFGSTSKGGWRRKKKSINRVEEGSKEGEKKFLTLTVVGEAEQRPRRPSEAAARLSAHRGPKSR